MSFIASEPWGILGLMMIHWWVELDSGMGGHAAGVTRISDGLLVGGTGS